jgi:hypothetical protein
MVATRTRVLDRSRLAQLPRTAGEPHAYETAAATVQRYLEMQRDCSEAQSQELSA